jgi:hypothetical protein
MRYINHLFTNKYNIEEIRRLAGEILKRRKEEKEDKRKFAKGVSHKEGIGRSYGPRL